MPNIIYEDNHIIVVIKPQNMPTQEDNSKDLDLLSEIKDYIKQTYQKPGNVFVGLVHRLDRPTGGVMVFAKTSKAASRLSTGIKDGSFEKTYLAVVTGKPRLGYGRLTHYLKKDEKENMVRIATQLETGSKLAELDYRTIDTKNKMSLIKINLLTGRSHQIRVQMSAIKCPVVGDTKYGEVKASTPLALWAAILKFNHPTTGKRMSFCVFPPQDAPWNSFNINTTLNIDS
ncbi:MAG: RluA family pseudouridine synthase [Christensenellaceae bacterium]|jgi:23S rRNA pseudouridine1911/1915/1917 synthase|nr:RluA family pseudouridine synthase [Christensenellaceae bacterium]